MFTPFTSVTLSLFVGTAILVGQHGLARCWGWDLLSLLHILQGEGHGHPWCPHRTQLCQRHPEGNAHLQPVERHWLQQAFPLGGRHPDERRTMYPPSRRASLSLSSLSETSLWTPRASAGEGTTARQAATPQSSSGWLLLSGFSSTFFSSLSLDTAPTWWPSPGSPCSFATHLLLPPPLPPIIRLQQSTIEFSFGWSFWLVLVAGCLCVLMGRAVSIIDLI